MCFTQVAAAGFVTLLDYGFWAVRTRPTSPPMSKTGTSGSRAGLRGWPSAHVAGAQVEHRHRARTSRYYTSQQLDAILELNYLKVSSPERSRRGGFSGAWGCKRWPSPSSGSSRCDSPQVVRQAAGIAPPGLAAVPAFSETSSER